MIDEIHEQLQAGIGKSHEALRRDLSRIRAGRANADLLDGIRVDYYGSPTPLKQLASIAVPEARLLTVKPFDRSQIRAVERAILDSELGLNPQNDGELIRIPMPALTEDRRKELVKLVRKHGEECKVSIRKARHDAKDLLDELKKEGEASEDDVERALKKVEELVQGGVGRVDEMLAVKEKDIIEL